MPLLILINCAILSAQGFNVELQNISTQDLHGTTIVLDQSNSSPEKLAKLDSTFGVFDGTTALPSQWAAGKGDQTSRALMFLAPALAPGEKKTLEIRPGGHGAIKPVAAAKYVLPRMDVAWENDRTAHRIYGGPNAGDVRDGIDVWVKRVRYPIMDNWYNGDSLKGKKRISYHVDHGEGADYFDVKKSLGAGGSGLWSGGSVHHFGFFRSQEILASGPLRARFVVKYDSTFGVGEDVKCARVFTLDAGSNLTKIEMTVQSSRSADSLVAIGLVKRENVQRDADSSRGWLSLWGPVDKDSTHAELGIGIIVPPASIVGFQEDESHVYVIARLNSSGSLTYFAGAGWTKSGDFAGRTDWNQYLANFQKPKYTIVAH